MLRLSQRYPRRRAFVTGAAGGYGRALCEHLAADGWTLGLADRDADGLDDAAEHLANLGATPLPYAFDVTDADAFRAAASAFLSTHDGVDLVINNAGMALSGLLEDTSLDDWRAILEVNLMGVVHGCHIFVPVLKEAGSGHLLNVASIAAVAAGPYMTAYNASKAAVLALSETLYSECRAAGVNVSVALPYFFRTNIARAALGDAASRQIMRKLVERSPFTAEDVAAYTLAQAGKERLHILYPPKARLLWHWKRLLPRHFLGGMVKRAAQTARAYARHNG